MSGFDIEVLKIWIVEILSQYCQQVSKIFL